MSAVDRAQDRVDELRALLAQIRDARRDVPSLRKPTGAVGARGTWTGSAADRLHRDELAPLAGTLEAALSRAEQDVADELQHAERSLDRAQEEKADQEAKERSRA